jgi:hypothetical protein
MKHSKLFLTGMAALLLSFGLMMTGCDSGGDSDSGTTLTPPPPPDDLAMLYMSKGTVGTTDTTFVLELEKVIAPRASYAGRAAYTPAETDKYTLYVGATPAEGSSFDYATAPSQSGTVTAKTGDVLTLTPAAPNSANTFKATITGGALSKIEKDGANETINLSLNGADSTVTIVSAGFSLTKIDVPTLGGTVKFSGDDPVYKAGVPLTADVTGLTFSDSPGTTPTPVYR